jgi:hypothetical protein
MRRDIAALVDEMSRVSTDPLAAGRIGLSGIDEVRDFIGAGWEDLNIALERVVEQALTPIGAETVAFTRQDDASFIFVAGNLIDAEIGRVSKDVTNRLRAGLSGDGAPGGGAIDARCDLAVVEASELALTQGPATLVGSINTAVERAVEAERRAFAEEKGGLRPLYWPMTNVSKGLISFYRTEIVAAGSDQDRAPTNAVLEQFDLFGLERLSHDLATQTGARHRANALLSVHFQTLSERASRGRFLDLANAAPPMIRRRVAVEISDTPPDISQSRLSQLFTEMSPYFLGVVCRFPVTYKGLERLAGLKLLGVSLDGSILGKDRPRKAQFREILRFSKQASDRGLRSFFLRAASVEAAIAARRAEFSYVAGPGVLQPLPNPGRVYKL